MIISQCLQGRWSCIDFSGAYFIFFIVYYYTHTHTRARVLYIYTMCVYITISLFYCTFSNYKTILIQPLRLLYNHATHCVPYILNTSTYLSGPHLRGRFRFFWPYYTTHIRHRFQQNSWSFGRSSKRVTTIFFVVCTRYDVHFIKL